MTASYIDNQIVIDVEEKLEEGTYDIAVRKEDGTREFSKTLEVDGGDSISASVTPSYSTWPGNNGSTVRIDIENTGTVDIENAVLIVESDMQIRNNPSDYWGLSIAEGPTDLDGGGYGYKLRLEGSTGSAVTIPFGGTEWCGWNTTNPNPTFSTLKIDGDDGGGIGNGDVKRPENNTGTGFFTRNGGIYDYKGNRFIMRGINDMGVWFDTWTGAQPNVNARANIANLGCNAIRITWHTNFQTNQNDANQRLMIRKLIQSCIDNNMVPLFEIQDSTGRNNDRQMLETFVPWYIERAAIWNDFEEYIIMNPFNEWGDFGMSRGTANRRRFPDVYKRVITAFRNANIKSPIAIDPFEWGKDYSLIIEHGKEIYDHDPETNIIFSVHFYAGHGENEASIRDCIRTISRMGLPLIIGEFGDRRSSPEDIKEDTIMSECSDNKVGWLAWSWTGNQRYHDMTKRWDADQESELTDWGQRVFFGPNGIREEAEIASIFNP
ncbi:MAG: cellulase family glycosylhydrolase [Cyanobacteria bacterium P01_F01_bin.143]